MIHRLSSPRAKFQCQTDETYLFVSPSPEAIEMADEWTHANPLPERVSNKRFDVQCSVEVQSDPLYF